MGSWPPYQHPQDPAWPLVVLIVGLILLGGVLGVVLDEVLA